MRREGSSCRLNLHRAGHLAQNQGQLEDIDQFDPLDGRWRTPREQDHEHALGLAASHHTCFSIFLTIK
jgi:hypothetical protein